MNWSSIPPFWILVLGGILFYSLLFVVDRRWGRKLLNRDFNERERKMSASLLKSETAFNRLELTVDLLKEQLDEKERQSAERDQKISALTELVKTLTGQLETETRNVADLKRQLESKQVIEQPQASEEFNVLGIWPDAPGQPALDQQGEADALYNAGFSYVALRGTRANRAGVILEIDRIRPTVIQVGGHGNSEGTLLSDGLAEPGWWGLAVAGKGVKLMLLLSCDSSQQDELNISDALIRAGVKAVVSCDSQIGDMDAVRFAQLLYAKMSEGMPLKAAAARAKLSVSRKAGEMIRLRETL